MSGGMLSTIVMQKIFPQVRAFHFGYADGVSWKE